MKNLIKDFPIFNQKEKKIIYFDNASTSQKPKQVIDAISNFYSNQYANVNRGIYKLSENSTDLYNKARQEIADFIGAKFNEVIFTSGTTESINFVASTWAQDNLKEGDEIILTELEHHSNILPWMALAKQKKLIIKYVPVKSNGELDYQEYLKLLSNKTKLVSFLHVSNAIGTQVDAEFIIKHAKNFGAKTLIDVAQSIGHQEINVKILNPDFLVFSGHKILGPTGIGILYIAESIQDQVRPYQFGGSMVFEIKENDATWQKAPGKYEAGTPPIAQAIGLAQAVKYIRNNINFDELKKHEANLCMQLINGLEKFNKIKILGPIEELKKSGHIVSFNIEGFHAHDIAAYLDQFNICVRAGNHCAQPLFRKLKLESSVRISFYFYNTQEEVNILLDSIKKLLA